MFSAFFQRIFLKINFRHEATIFTAATQSTLSCLCLCFTIKIFDTRIVINDNHTLQSTIAQLHYQTLHHSSVADVVSSVVCLQLHHQQFLTSHHQHSQSIDKINMNKISACAIICNNNSNIIPASLQLFHSCMSYTTWFVIQIQHKIPVRNKISTSIVSYQLTITSFHIAVSFLCPITMTPNKSERSNLKTLTTNRENHSLKRSFNNNATAYRTKSCALFNSKLLKTL